MSQSTTAPKIYTNLNWFYFDQPLDSNHLVNLLSVLDLNQLASYAIKILLMTKFDRLSAAS